MMYFRGNALRAPTLQQSGEYQALWSALGLLVYDEFRDVAQLVARTAGGGEAAGSSPVIPTTMV
jgi:hypothetical protein